MGLAISADTRGEVILINEKFVRTIVPFCQYEVKTKSAGWIRVVAMNKNHAVERLYERGYEVAQ